MQKRVYVGPARRVTLQHSNARRYGGDDGKRPGGKRDAPVSVGCTLGVVSVVVRHGSWSRGKRRTNRGLLTRARGRGGGSRVCHGGLPGGKAQDADLG
jgi:hypothetical protein